MDVRIKDADVDVRIKDADVDVRIKDADVDVRIKDAERLTNLPLSTELECLWRRSALGASHGSPTVETQRPLSSPGCLWSSLSLGDPFSIRSVFGAAGATGMSLEQPETRRPLFHGGRWRGMEQCSPRVLIPIVASVIAFLTHSNTLNAGFAYDDRLAGLSGMAIACADHVYANRRNKEGKISIQCFIILAWRSSGNSPSKTKPWILFYTLGVGFLYSPLVSTEKEGIERCKALVHTVFPSLQAFVHHGVLILPFPACLPPTFCLISLAECWINSRCKALVHTVFPSLQAFVHHGVLILPFSACLPPAFCLISLAECWINS
ncbi:unnamed protein product, partial [Cyprideis torosa]